MRKAAAIGAAVIVFLVTVPAARAAYFMTALMTNPSQSGGYPIDDDQFIGARFTVSSPVTIDRVGGYFGQLLPSGSGNGKIFGAIIQFSGPNDVPDSLDLSTPDVLATTTFTPPNVSADITAPIGPLTLSNGTYGVLFGSNLFGATGLGKAPNGATNVGSPVYFWRDSGTPHQWRTDSFPAVRLTVFAVGDPPVPEPAGLALVALATPLLARRRRRRLSR